MTKYNYRGSPYRKTGKRVQRGVEYYAMVIASSSGEPSKAYLEAREAYENSRLNSFAPTEYYKITEKKTS